MGSFLGLIVSINLVLAKGLRFCEMCIYGYFVWYSRFLGEKSQDEEFMSHIGIVIGFFSRRI